MGNILGLDVNDTGEMIDRIEGGFRFNLLVRFQKMSGLPMATIAHGLRMSPRTMDRRKEAGRLHPQESERLLRLADLFGKSVELFEGDVDGAKHWFIRPKRALDNHSPISFARTEVGGREVEQLIGRLEHGCSANP